MGAMASRITSLTNVYSTIYSGVDQRKHQKLRVTGLCAGNSPVTGEFPAQIVSNAEYVFIWRRHASGETRSANRSCEIADYHKAFNVDKVFA